MKRPLLGLLLCSCSVFGQSTTSDVRLEIYDPVLVAPARVLGKAGAVVGIAEGSGVQNINPAAVANRYTFSGDVWFDFDFDSGVMKTSRGSAYDIENNGRSLNSALSSQLAEGAINLQFGRFGIGFSSRQSSFVLCSDSSVADQTLCPDSELLEFRSGVEGLNLGWNFFSGQFVVGLRGEVPGLALYRAKEFSPTAELKQDQVPASWGFLWRPSLAPFRLGAAYNPRVFLDLSPGASTTTVAGVALPTRAMTPERVAVGVSYQLGKRIYNPISKFSGGSYSSPSGESRGYWLLSADLQYVGPSVDGAGLEAWLDGEVQQKGRSATYNVHLGLETEAWLEVLKLRAGTYFEGSRFVDRNGRQHFTTGAELRLFKVIWEFSAVAAFDYAPRYLNWTAGIGFWH